MADQARKLLDLVDDTGLSGRELEKLAKIPQGFLSAAKAGKRATAEKSWRRLRSFLVERLGRVVVEATEGSPASAVETLARPARPAAPPAAEGPPPIDLGPLGERIRSARTLGAIRVLLHELGALVVEGRLDKGAGTLALAALKEARRELRAKRAERPPSNPLVASLEILDAEEAAAVDRVRAARLVPALAPGQAVAPPEEEQAAP